MIISLFNSIISSLSISSYLCWQATTLPQIRSLFTVIQQYIFLLEELLKKKFVCMLCSIFISQYATTLSFCCLCLFTGCFLSNYLGLLVFLLFFHPVTMVNLWKLMEHFYLFFCSWLKGFSVDWHRCDESKPCVSHSLIK